MVPNKDAIGCEEHHGRDPIASAVGTCLVCDPVSCEVHQFPRLGINSLTVDVCLIFAQYCDALVLNAPFRMPRTIYTSLGIDVVANGDTDTSLDGIKVCGCMLDFVAVSDSDSLPR